MTNKASKMAISLEQKDNMKHVGRNIVVNENNGSP